MFGPRLTIFNFHDAKQGVRADPTTLTRRASHRLYESMHNLRRLPHKTFRIKNLSS